MKSKMTGQTAAVGEYFVTVQTVIVGGKYIFMFLSLKYKNYKIYHQGEIYLYVLASKKLLEYIIRGKYIFMFLSLKYKNY